MKTWKWNIVAIFLLIGGAFYAQAQDMIVLKDGNVIEAKVMEISPTEIRYKRFDHLDGPTIVVPAANVLSIKYEKGVLDIINASPTNTPRASAPPTNASPANAPPAAQVGQTEGAASYGPPEQLGAPTALQTILNALPAIPIAGNNLKFQFGGDKWVATVNGENFSAGTIGFEATDEGSIITLKQTHIWPGAVGKTAGRVANMIPGGAAVGGVLNTAGQIAGAVGAVEAPGLEIVLEYKAGPPAKLSFLRSRTTRSPRGTGTPSDAGVHPLEAENRFDLDGFNVFATSINGTVGFFGEGVGGGGGLTLTIFEKYKPDVFFIPSYFLSGIYGRHTKYEDKYESGYVNIVALGAGVIFKHRFPRNRVLWNLGTSLEFMWAQDVEKYSNHYKYDDDEYYYYEYSGESFLLGLCTQTGFSFRFNPYTSFDLKGLLRFPFGTVLMRTNDFGHFYGPNNVVVSSLPDKSFWPFTAGIELALTFWVPYRSREQR
jgi:hypothetical protein